MSTDELIRRLSSRVAPVSRHALEKRLFLGAGAGFLLSLALLAMWLGLRPANLAAPFIGAFLTKLVYASLLAAASIAASVHLMRPESRPASWFILAAAPVAVLALLAVIELINAPRETWPVLLFGASAASCLLRISVISIPIFLGFIWAARSFAPTRLRIAGASIGVAAGSLSAAIYALHCIETAACFIFLWYSAAILIAAVGGALVAPRLLRW